MMSGNGFLFILFAALALLSFSPCAAMSAWMAKNYCSTPLEADEVIMGDMAIISTEREVQLLRRINNGTEEEVVSDLFEPGETLIARLLDSTGQYVFQVDVEGGSDQSKATFVDGGCEGRRIADVNDAELKMPLVGTVSVKAGWSLGHAQVKITKSVTLRPSKILTIPTLTVGGARLRGVVEGEREGEAEGVGGGEIVDIQTRLLDSRYGSVLFVFVAGGIAMAVRIGRRPKATKTR
jgi:hypothetical protein